MGELKLAEFLFKSETMPNNNLTKLLRRLIMQMGKTNFLKTNFCRFVKKTQNLQKINPPEN